MHEASIHAVDRVLPTSADPWAQQLLEQREMTFERRQIAFSLIDRDASLRNQARINPLNPDTVDIYRAAMEQGEEFPPIVVSGLGPKLVVLDGNHRSQAAIAAGFTHTDAYVVTQASRASVELFTYEANTRHGMPTSLEERTRQGMYLVSIGNKVIDVVRALSLPEARFRDEVNVSRQRQRLAGLKVDVARMSRTQLDRIASVRNDNVAKAMAELLISISAGSENSQELITGVNRLGTEATQLAFVAEQHKRYAPLIRSTAGGRLALPRNINRILMAVRLVDNIETDELPSQIKNLDPEFRKVIASDSANAVQKFVEVLSAMKRADDGE